MCCGEHRPHTSFSSALPMQDQKPSRVPAAEPSLFSSAPPSAAPAGSSAQLAHSTCDLVLCLGFSYSLLILCSTPLISRRLSYFLCFTPLQRLRFLAQPLSCPVRLAQICSHHLFLRVSALTTSSLFVSLLPVVLAHPLPPCFLSLPIACSSALPALSGKWASAATGVGCPAPQRAVATCPRPQ